MKVGIIALAEPKSQTDPKFQTLFKYTHKTAKAIRIALMIEKGWQDKDLPCEKTMGAILNRLDYCLRRVQKAKPLKKIPETDAIFDNLIDINKVTRNK